MITITMSEQTAREFLEEKSIAKRKVRRAIKDCLPVKNASVHVDKEKSNVSVFSISDDSNNNVVDYRDKTVQPTHCTAPKGEHWKCKHFPKSLDSKKRCPNRTRGLGNINYCIYIFNGGPVD